MALQAQVAKAQQEASLVKEGKLDPDEIRARWVASRGSKVWRCSIQSVCMLWARVCGVCQRLCKLMWVCECVLEPCHG